MLPLIRHLVAVLSVLAFASSGWAQCAGWETAADARRACCTNGQCPMHRSGGEESTGRIAISQAQADSCCASAERSDSTPSTSSNVAGFPVAVVTPQIPALGPDVAVFRALSAPPADVSPVPKHLLLSVFLI